CCSVLSFSSGQFLLSDRPVVLTPTGLRIPAQGRNAGRGVLRFHPGLASNKSRNPESGCVISLSSPVIPFQLFSFIGRQSPCPAGTSDNSPMLQLWGPRSRIPESRRDGRIPASAHFRLFLFVCLCL